MVIDCILTGISSGSANVKRMLHYLVSEFDIMLELMHGTRLHMKYTAVRIVAKQRHPPTVLPAIMAVSTLKPFELTS